MKLFEVIGFPKTCPSETFSVGTYQTIERAEEVKAKSYTEYSRCEFEIETKWMEE